ncbi:MAG: hypothetical protein EPN82_09195 [Bacteroidetes bacterium]|nr:MAG: hypothetical protein EPN82_09195 [Bacteroidota bacterium]
MTLTPNQHKAIAIILFLALTVFLRLGSSEIQPNEEGRNAMFAKSILKNVNSEYNVNKIVGSYANPKSLFPAWMITAVVFVLGENTFTVRLFSALCSAMALVFFYLISRRLLNYSYSIIALFLLSGTILWNNFARQATSDIPGISFILASLFFLLKVIEPGEKKEKLVFSILFSISFIFSMLTNFIASLIPVFFIINLFFDKDKRKLFNLLVIHTLIAIIISLLFNSIIYLNHNSGFSHFLFNYHTFTEFSKITFIGLIHNFNQIIINNPVSIFGLYIIIYMIFKRNDYSANTEHGKYLIKSFVVWYIIFFILLFLIPGEHPANMIYFLPVAILLSLRFFEKMQILTGSGRIKWLIVTILISFFLWSFIFELRYEVELLLSGDKQTLFALLYFILIVVSIIAGLLLPEKHLENYSPIIMNYVVTAISYLLIFKIILLNIATPSGESFGAAKTAEVLNATESKSFIYFYHSNNPEDSVNFQLDWYTSGWLSGWKSGKTFIPVSLPENNINYENLRIADEYPDLFIVYYTHPNLVIKSAVMKDLILTRSIISKTNNYIIFGRKNSERLLDKPI